MKKVYFCLVAGLMLLASLCSFGCQEPVVPEETPEVVQSEASRVATFLAENVPLQLDHAYWTTDWEGNEVEFSLSTAGVITSGDTMTCPAGELYAYSSLESGYLMYIYCPNHKNYGDTESHSCYTAVYVQSVTGGIGFLSMYLDGKACCSTKEELSELITANVSTLAAWSSYGTTDYVPRSVMGDTLRSLKVYRF